MGLVKSQTKYVSSISAALAHFQPALLSPLRLVCMQHHTIQAFARLISLVGWQKLVKLLFFCYGVIMPTSLSLRMQRP